MPFEHVRYRRNSGKHLLLASISQFDPERKSRRFEERSPSDRKKYIEPVKWSPLANVSWFLNDGAKRGHEDLALRAGLTADAAPSLLGGKVCR